MNRPLRATLVGGLTLSVLGSVLVASASASAGAGASAGAEAAAGPSTGTIVYLRDHDVWIARGDGSGARALTRDGTFAEPYGSPTQSDAGVVVATHTNRLVRMNQSGRVLGTLDPRPLPTSVGVAIDGTPAHAAISPDGRRIAYTFTKYLDPVGASPGYRSATGYTAADRLTDPAPHRTTYFWDPSWIGNGRTAQTGGYGSHVNLHDLGSEPKYWFGAESTDFGNTALSRDGRLLAGILGYDDTSTLAFMEVSGNATSGPPPAAPEALCGVGPALGITNPAWGPGSTLLWEESDGIWTHPDARRCGAVDSALLVRGGSEPHWSPASLSSPAPAPTPALRSTRRPDVTGKARVGKVLRATPGQWSPRASSVSYRWYRDARPITGGAGAKAARKVVRADRGHRLSVRVTARRPGYTAATRASAAVQVRR